MPFKPPIFSRTFVTASNLSYKRVVFNRMQHTFKKFTCAKRNSQHTLIYLQNLEFRNMTCFGYPVDFARGLRCAETAMCVVGLRHIHNKTQ